MSLAPLFLLPEWQAPPGVRALSTMRRGGVSAPPRDSLNLGAHVGDDREAVAANRRRLRDAAGLPAEPQWLDQVHGIDVADLDHEDCGPCADAAVSSRPGRVCVVLTADCLPVVLASSDLLELTSMSDRVYVMTRGRIAGEFAHADQATLLAAAANG